MCRMTFYEPKALKTDVMRLLQLHGICHLIEPSTVDQMVYYVIEGPIQAINAYHRDYEPIRIRYNRRYDKRPLWLRLLRMLGGR